MNQQFQRANNVRIDINKYYFDPDGVLIDGATLPDELKTRLPWFCFSKFDFDCNYKNAASTLNPDPWKFIGAYSRTEIKFLFTGFNNFQSQMKSGDLSLLFTDDVINPQYYALVVLSSQGGGLTGIIQNAEFYTPFFDVYSDNPSDDYIESITFGAVSKFGVSAGYDSYPLSQSYTPSTEPDNNKILVNLEFTASFQNWIGGFISFSTQNYYIDFRKITF